MFSEFKKIRWLKLKTLSLIILSTTIIFICFAAIVAIEYALSSRFLQLLK